MISPNFAQTCGTYDNKTFRRPTFYQHALHPLLAKPLPPRPQTPFTKRKRLHGIQGIHCLPEAPEKEKEKEKEKVENDVFDLQNKPTLNNNNAVDEKDYLDSDSDFETDGDGDEDEDEDENGEEADTAIHNKKKEAWKNYITVTDLVEETIKKTYYCRKCFEKFKSKFSNRKRKSIITPV
jgi:hypothetical protein